MTTFEENPLKAIYEELLILRAELKELKEAKPEEAEEVGTVKDAARWTKMAESTIYKLTSTRKIPYFKRGGSNRYSRSQLIAWMQENQPKTEQQIRAEVQERNPTVKKKKPD